MQQSEPFKDAVADALQYIAGVQFQRMYRQWGVYYGDHFIGIIRDDTLYLRTNHLTRLTYIQRGMQSLFPKDKILRSFYEVPEDIVADHQKLTRWALEAASVNYTVPKLRGEYR
jgi:TfoX/Sxy family transcriptional regulator of competence genes